jgi:hypothetical protein
MSFAADHESKQARRSCQACHDRKARFRFRGKVRADRDHVLCFACFRAQRDRNRAEGIRLLCTSLAERRPTLTARAIAHRQRMLAHLTHSTGGAPVVLVAEEGR